MSACLFCGIVNGSVPATIAAEDERTLAFMYSNPASDGHALVVPRSHSVDLIHLDPDDLVACTLTAQRLAQRAVDALGADGVNLLNCSGEAAWQTVFHFHLHVIPRFARSPERDRLHLPWTPSPGDLEAIRAVGARLRG